MRYVARGCKPEDIASLAKDIRQEDVDEWYCSDVRGLDALPDCIAWCQKHGECGTIARKDDDSGHIIWGLNPGKDNLPNLTWMLGTNEAAQNGMIMLLRFKGFMEEVLNRWDVTWCFSDARNVVHHKWLRYFGYDHVRILPFGPYGLPFHEYVRFPPCA